MPANGSGDHTAPDHAIRDLVGTAGAWQGTAAESPSSPDEGGIAARGRGRVFPYGSARLAGDAATQKRQHRPATSLSRTWASYRTATFTVRPLPALSVGSVLRNRRGFLSPGRGGGLGGRPEKPEVAGSIPSGPQRDKRRRPRVTPGGAPVDARLCARLGG
jgi:hypothetical protein